ncbi:hypothetical protein TA3x_003637 [Tundrisphaera sp. TA3]|uniref:hypothetical protein n=1 Tax=Tundrisphaera sp. TA3 TaxID=3435775 RepID=UPI003EB88F46
MSRGARILLGVFFVFCAVCFLAIAAAIGPMMIPFALFCGVAAVACLSPGSHPVTIRILGATVFLLCLLYLGSTLRKPMARAEHRPNSKVPAIVYGLACFVTIGLPAGYAAATGRYPGWGRGAEAFGAKKKRKKKRPAGGVASTSPAYPRRP